MDKVEGFARYLAEGFGCRNLVFTPDDPGVPRAVPVGSGSSHERAIVVCHAGSRVGRVVPDLQQYMDQAPAGLLVAHPGADLGRPEELQSFLRERGLKVPFAGWVSDDDYEQRDLIAVLENNSAPPMEVDPNGLRVVAFMATYNEMDIIEWSLRYLIKQGIEVYVIDNWSTDGTFERACEFLGKGVTGIERFPREQPTATYEWRSILGRVEALSQEIEADWFMLHDADERRHSPWEGVGLKASLLHVDRCGFNCVDHVVLNHWPTDNRFDPAHDVENQLRYYEFSDHAGHFHQRKVWKNPRCAVSLAPTAGHDICFPGRLVYPYKFVMKHYPIRSQSHGERKVFAERMGRWSPAERSLGWHQQYDALKPADSFLRDPASLEDASGKEFEQKYLIERLSGIGVFSGPPAWATGPRESFEAVQAT